MGRPMHDPFVFLRTTRHLHVRLFLSTLNTNSSAPSEAGENCSRIKFVWDGNGTNFSKAAVANAVKSIGKNWLLLTNDYVWGHSTAAATKSLIEANGGTIALTAAAGKDIVNSLIVAKGVLKAQSVGIKNGEIIISAAGSNKTNKKGHLAAILPP